MSVIKYDIVLECSSIGTLVIIYSNMIFCIAFLVAGISKLIVDHGPNIIKQLERGYQTKANLKRSGSSSLLMIKES